MKVENAHLLRDDQQLGLIDYLISKQFKASVMGDWTFEHPEHNELAMATAVASSEIRQAAGLPRDQIVSIGWTSQTNQATITLPTPTQGLGT